MTPEFPTLASNYHQAPGSGDDGLSWSDAPVNPAILEALALCVFAVFWAFALACILKLNKCDLDSPTTRSRLVGFTMNQQKG